MDCGPTREFRAWILGMLADLPAKRERLTLFKAHKFALRQTAHGCAPELPCRAPRRFLAPIDAVAKHLRYYFGPPKKMDLKTMSLFLRASFCIYSSNVRLRLGVGADCLNWQVSRD